MVTNRLNKKKVLITCGPTWIPIDDVRVISNHSSGVLGQGIAKELSKCQARVTLLEGPVRAPLNHKSIKVIKFDYYDELILKLKRELNKKYDIVIHAAAVSDYKVNKVSSSKIRSDLKKLPLTLVPTKKIINSIKKLSPKSFLVGFKLESKINNIIARQQSLKLFQQAKCDLVLVNSMKNKQYKAIIVDKMGNILGTDESKGRIVKHLIATINKHI